MIRFSVENKKQRQSATPHADESAPLRVMIVIPIFNEERNIVAVIDDLHAVLASHSIFIIAVDDGSTDGTSAVLESCALRYPGKIQIIKQPRNLGVQDAFWAGFSAAVQHDDAQAIVCCEGDGTSDLHLLPDMLTPIVAGYDIVIASRYMTGGGQVGFPAHRRFVSRLGNVLLNFLFPYPGLTDFTIFYRAYRAQFLRRLLHEDGKTAFRGRGFSANTSLLLTGLRDHPKIAEVANIYDYRLKKSKSAFRLAATVMGHLLLLFSPDLWQTRAACLAKKKLPVS